MDSTGLARDDTTRSLQPPSASVVVIRPKKPRRYKLLSKQRLKVPNPFPKKYEYTKHMPLINIDTEDEDSEAPDSQLLKKVSNQSLNDLLHHDRGHRSEDASDNDEDNDWDLTLTSTRLQHPTNRCGCFNLPHRCSIS
ncbi:hypothetical protein EG68_04062 [Paragonimus skrjabini miyazakii]|uniref:Uncharacterized protein n=1 Tax=Paragonimus skrjabini miyazakii TaxID=59628 RepID=A0A8S9Z1Q1_9TREM|nr:hypothetical protein EG68_04062 [Paragonimus skrjabini miyazakii]